MPIYESTRKIRSLPSGKGKYREYIVNLPKEWVNALAREHGVDPENLELKIWYNGEFRASVVDESGKTQQTEETKKGDFRG